MNCYDDMDGRLFGSYEGLKAELEEALSKAEDVDERSSIKGLLAKLETFKHYKGGLVINDHGGMGESIEKGEL